MNCMKCGGVIVEDNGLFYCIDCAEIYDKEEVQNIKDAEMIEADMEVWRKRNDYQKFTDDFLNKTHCDRCGKELTSFRIMSMFNTECLCTECKEKETKHPDYDKARKADLEEIKKGNYNFQGIGWNE